MSSRETQHLRVLIANERRDRLELVVPIVASLGHEVIAREIEVNDGRDGDLPGAARTFLRWTWREPNHAEVMMELGLHEAECPVIVLIHAPDPDFVREASKRGVFAYITDGDADALQNNIDIVLRRFAEFHDSAPSGGEPRSNAPRGFSWSATGDDTICRHASRPPRTANRIWHRRRRLRRALPPPKQATELAD